MNWCPLSKRDTADPRFDEPSDGIPGYLQTPIEQWFLSAVGETFYPTTFQIDSIKHLQLRFRLDPPLDWRSFDVAVNDLLSRMFSDEEFGLDVIDYVVSHGREFQGLNYSLIVYELNTILVSGGSAWEVAEVSGSESGFELQRRASPTVRQSVEMLAPGSRAEAHLAAAWNSLHGREPDASMSYKESVRAVEAAAKPIITPNDSQATLGKMISAVLDAPHKWTFDVFPVEALVSAMKMLWNGQSDRHGTDDPNVPKDVSVESADVALHTAILLVRVFTSGAVKQVD